MAGNTCRLLNYYARDDSLLWQQLLLGSFGKHGPEIPPSLSLISHNSTDWPPVIETLDSGYSWKAKYAARYRVWKINRQQPLNRFCMLVMWNSSPSFFDSYLRRYTDHRESKVSVPSEFIRCSSSYVYMIFLLLKFNALFMMPLYRQRTLLGLACEYGNLKMAKHLIGTNVNYSLFDQLYLESWGYALAGCMNDTRARKVAAFLLSNKLDLIVGSKTVKDAIRQVWKEEGGGGQFCCFLLTSFTKTATFGHLTTLKLLMAHERTRSLIGYEDLSYALSTAVRAEKVEVVDYLITKLQLQESG